MLTTEFVEELQKLSRAEKLRVVQLLVNDLATAEEMILHTDTQYEIWSPYDSDEAGSVLMQMLKEDRE